MLNTHTKTRTARTANQALVDHGCGLQACPANMPNAAAGRIRHDRKAWWLWQPGTWQPIHAAAVHRLSGRWARVSNRHGPSMQLSHRVRAVHTPLPAKTSGRLGSNHAQKSSVPKPLLGPSRMKLRSKKRLPEHQLACAWTPGLFKAAGSLSTMRCSGGQQEH